MFNKKGWSLIEMLLLMGVLAIFLFIATYLIYKSYNDNSKVTNNTYYHELETKLEHQAEIYLDNYYEENLTSDYIIITSNILDVYDLDVTLSDPSGRACEGYVRANKTKGVRSIKGYIKCPNYITENY